MNIDGKVIALVTVGVAVMFGWNFFLIQRDNKMFDTMKQRNAEVCAMLHEGHPDCNGVKR